MAEIGTAAIAALWVKNGGLPTKTREAVAVVLCEAPGKRRGRANTRAVSPVGARGMWQFMPGTLSSDACAYNPDCATREAVKLSNGGRDFSAWDCHPDSRARSGYGTGDATYERIFADLKTPLGDIPLPGPDFDFTNPLGPLSPINPLDGIPNIQDPVPGASNPLEVLKGINAFFTGLGELILTPEGWLRLGKILGGSIFIMWGLRIIIRESTGSDPVKAATNTVKKGAEVAALAATVK